VAIDLVAAASGSSAGVGAIRRRPARPAATLLPITELEPRDLAAWRELAERAAEPNPFFEPECVLPAARHLGESDIALLVVKDTDRDWLACLPVRPHLRRWHARLPVLAAWRHIYGCLGTPLVSRSELELATGRLLAQAFRASSVGVVAFPWLGDDGPVAAGLLSALEASGRSPALHRSFERAIMRRSTLSGGVDAVITSRHRRDLGRLARRLAEKLDAPLELRDESGRAGAVEDFLALEGSGWKGEDGTALSSRPAHAEYFRELCAGFRAAGRLQLLALGAAEQTVSAKCNLLAGDGVFCFKIAHDESFAHYRPGLQLELRMLELFRDQMSETWMDSCSAADSSLFEHFWPERRPIGSYLVTAGGAVGWTINHGIAALHGLHGS
jgi:CelD/BcsL family acetyltransferase involved in cellulose biosynthesis